MVRERERERERERLYDFDNERKIHYSCTKNFILSVHEFHMMKEV
jgi:hypothetical protein